MSLFKYIRISIIGIISFFILPQILLANLEGEIRPPEDTVQGIDIKIVDYGLCFIGDTLKKTFILRNTGSEFLKIGSTDPTYFNGLYPKIANHDNDFFEFNPPPEDKPEFLIAPGIDRELKMYYVADDTSKYKAGKKYALLKLGLYDSKLPDVPAPGYGDMVALDSFLLIARKTTHYIDGYESENYFDSVYVNPPIKVSWTWPVKNVSTNNLQIDSDTLIPLSPNPDFIITKNLPQPIYQKNVIDWQIEFNPQDIGGDSAVYRLKYHPHPILYPDSIDYAVVKLHGIGVKQKMDIDFSDNAKPYGDTLDVGEVWVDSTKQIKTVLKNTGNMKFGTISQKILNYKGGTDSIFTLIEGVRELPFHLDTNKTTDTIKFNFSPIQRGTFISEYILVSDIIRRNIKGIPSEGLNQKIYLKGTGIEPEISVARDTVDFGNVVLHLDCDSTDILNLPINNNGNTILEIQDVSIDPPFTPITPISELAIPPNSQRILQIEFNAKTPGIGNHSDTLFIISRDVRPPKDTLKLIVRASSVNPQGTRLLIPDAIKAKPGRLISVPIIVDKEHINIARIFSDSLIYNASLLSYNGFEKVGTASEGANFVNIGQDINTQRLGIYIEMPQFPQQVFFQQKDTLIILKFKTYLGDNVQTEIAFAAPQFSDGICSKVLTPDITNGRFSLDSICGLSLKAIPHITKKFRFEDIFPNPAFDKIQFEYEMAYSTNIKINLYNSYGELVETMINTEIPAGTYQLTYPTSEMTPGVYYFEMQAGLFRNIKKVILTK
ncbi:MAG: T9SS type A sorting domain-containing protein [Ignavibacteriae bacterium]|nr:T9SS type A sorting domain-containing protein [Ignavibacteriota bacterium]